MKPFVPIAVVALGILCMGQDECAPPPQSTTGVRKATAEIQTQASGLTIEQENVRERLRRDNLPGSIKHLYIISPWTGDVLIYSTVRGKVSSSGKRLTPSQITGGYGSAAPGFALQFGPSTYYTDEVLQDDGTYGSSAEYLYWFDSQGRYHQHYPGASVVHISDQPLSVGKAVINLDPTFGKEK